MVVAVVVVEDLDAVSDVTLVAIADVGWFCYIVHLALDNLPFHNHRVTDGVVAVVVAASVVNDVIVEVTELGDLVVVVAAGDVEEGIDHSYLVLQILVVMLVAFHDKEKAHFYLEEEGYQVVFVDYAVAVHWMHIGSYSHSMCYKVMLMEVEHLDAHVAESS